VFPLLVSPPVIATLDVNSAMDILHTFSFWHWLILGVLLVVLEIFAPGVVFMWVGVAALVTGMVAWLAPELAVQWQMIVFAVLSVTSVLGGRAWLKSHPMTSDHPTLSQRGQKYVGRRFTLSEPISGGFGKIKVDDTTWKVAGDDMAAGTLIEVTGVEGTVFLVERRD